MADADDDWESKDFEEEVELLKTAVKPIRADKLEGEDEEEPVKDNDDEAKAAAAAGHKPAVEVKKKEKSIGRCNCGERAHGETQS